MQQQWDNISEDQHSIDSFDQPPSEFGDHTSPPEELQALMSAMQMEMQSQSVIICDVLGSGGGGVVYKGEWKGLTVAIKTLLFQAHSFGAEGRRRHRSMLEAAITTSLVHPNVISTYSYDIRECGCAQTVFPRRIWGWTRFVGEAVSTFSAILPGAPAAVTRGKMKQVAISGLSRCLSNVRLLGCIMASDAGMNRFSDIFGAETFTCSKASYGLLHDS